MRNPQFSEGLHAEPAARASTSPALTIDPGLINRLDSLTPQMRHYVIQSHYSKPGEAPLDWGSSKHIEASLNGARKKTEEVLAFTRAYAFRDAEKENVDPLNLFVNRVQERVNDGQNNLEVFRAYVDDARGAVHWAVDQLGLAGYHDIEEPSADVLRKVEQFIQLHRP